MTTSHTERGAPAVDRSVKASNILPPGEIRRLIGFAVVLLVVVPTIAWFAGGNANWAETSWQLGFDGSAF